MNTLISNVVYVHTVKLDCEWFSGCDTSQLDSPSAHGDDAETGSHECEASGDDAQGRADGTFS